MMASPEGKRPWLALTPRLGVAVAAKVRLAQVDGFGNYRFPEASAKLSH